MTSQFVIEHNETPKSLNAGGTGSRRHWGQAHKEKKRWEGIFGMLMIEQKVPRHMASCEVHVELQFAKKAGRDVENYRSGVIKPFADTLVHGGWLADDTEEFFKVGIFALMDGCKLFPNNPLVQSRMIILIQAQYVQDD